MYDIVDYKKSVTPRIAVRLAKFFGNDPRTWLTLQLEYDLYLALEQVDVGSIPTFRVSALPEDFPTA